MPSMRHYMELIDSSINKQQLMESYKDAKKAFLDSEDDETVVDNYLERFKNLSKQNKVSGKHKDISYWIKQGWEDFKEFVDEAEKQYTKTQVKKRKAHSGSDVLTLMTATAISSTIDKVVVPLTRNSSCFYGKNTQWCTSVVSEDNRFGHYVGSGSILVYIITTEGNKFALVYDIIDNRVEEVRDSEDNKINPGKLDFLTGIEPEMIVKHLKKHMNTLEKVSRKYRLDDAYTAYRYANKIGKRFEEGEEVISEDTVISYYYAKNILKDRFHKAELKMGKGKFDDDPNEVNKHISRYIEEFQNNKERIKPLEAYIFSTHTDSSLKGTYLNKLNGVTLEENEEYIIDLLHNESENSYIKTIYLYLQNLDMSENVEQNINNFLTKMNEGDFKPLLDVLTKIKLNPKITSTIYTYIMNNHLNLIEQLSNTQLIRILGDSEYKGSIKKILQYINYDELLSTTTMTDSMALYLFADFVGENGSKVVNDLNNYMTDEHWVLLFKKAPRHELRKLLRIIDSGFPVNEIIKSIIKLERQSDRNDMLEDFKPPQNVIDKITDDVKDLMIEHNGKLLEMFDVENVDEKLLSKSLETYPYNIKYIEEPSEQQIAKALKGAFDMDVENKSMEHLDNIHRKLIKHIRDNDSLKKYYRFLGDELEDELMD